MVLKREVVTSFLWFGDKVLILRRSSKVKTMKGKWAGVSGYLEGDEEPAERALQEIHEETGLAKSEVELLERGERVEATDLLDKNLVWVVYPFLFGVTHPTITLDWENDEYRWIAPSEIHQYDTVPNLDRVLKSATVRIMNKHSE